MGVFKRKPSTWEGAYIRVGWVTWNTTRGSHAIPNLQLAELRKGRKYLHIRPVASDDWDPDQPLESAGIESLVKTNRLGFSMSIVDRLGRGALIAAGLMLMKTYLDTLPNHSGVVLDRLLRGRVPLKPSTQATLSRVVRDEDRIQFEGFLADPPPPAPPEEFQEWERIEGIGHYLLQEEAVAAKERGDQILSDALLAAMLRWLRLVHPEGSELHELGDALAPGILPHVVTPVEVQLELLKREYDEVATRLMIDEAIVLFRAIIHASAELGDDHANDLLLDPTPAADLADLALDDPEEALNSFVALVP